MSIYASSHHKFLIMKITLLKLFYLQNFITNKNFFFFFFSITNKNLKTHNRGLVANIKFLYTLYILIP